MIVALVDYFIAGTCLTDYHISWQKPWCKLQHLFADEGRSPSFHNDEQNSDPFFTANDSSDVNPQIVSDSP